MLIKSIVIIVFIVIVFALSISGLVMVTRAQSTVNDANDESDEAENLASAAKTSVDSTRQSVVNAQTSADDALHLAKELSKRRS